MKLIETIDIGNEVYCDYCNKDYTNSDECGGFLFSSRAICPSCADKYEESIKKYNEEKYIKERCKEGQSFRDFVIQLRNGNNKIIIESF